MHAELAGQKPVPQAAGFEAGAVQTPLTQVSPEAQILPHPPQLFTSFERLLHIPLQTEYPLMHWQ